MLAENTKIERILSVEEEKRLIESSISYLRPIIITALHTGMRRGEILGLKWSDVDMDAGVITVCQTNSKSKKERKIHMNSVLRKQFVELKLKSGGNDFVFLSDKGKKLKEIKNGYDAACRRAGIEGLRFHDLRHTAATRMIESGASIVAITRYLVIVTSKRP